MPPVLTSNTHPSLLPCLYKCHRHLADCKGAVCVPELPPGKAAREFAGGYVFAVSFGEEGSLDLRNVAFMGGSSTTCLA